MEIKTRFAPSPTGYIHIGNLRTALFSYLIAKHNQGKFILRIEDTDKERSNEKYEQYIFNALNLLGLNWDEGPYKQSNRKEIYIKYAKQLIEQGDAYYCFCPDCHSDIDRYKPEMNWGHKEDNDNFLGYNGHCRNLSKEEIEENLKNNKPYCIRQKLPFNKDITYNDEIYGKITINTKDLDDQVLIKHDGYPTYNFANVIDDHLMGITHIVRGNEYINSTPKYILLYNAFNWFIPTFVHLPLISIRDRIGKHKLSKRDNCSSFDNLIQDGYLPEAILNYIVLLGWNPKNNKEIFSLSELIDIFDIKNINKSEVIFDKNKLSWFNKQYFKNMSNEQFKQICMINNQNYPKDFNWDKIIPFIKDKINTTKDIFMNTYYLLNIKPNKDILFEYKQPITQEVIDNFKTYLNKELKKYKELKAQEYYNIIKEYSKQINISFGILMHIFRVWMSGLKDVMITGIDIAEFIGIDEVLRRINL